MIAIDSDTIGDTFEVSLSLSAILLGGSIAIAIGDTFFGCIAIDYRDTLYSIANINTDNDIVGNPQTNENPLTMCEPLVIALKAGVNKRFADVFSNDDAKLAAILTPKFKLDWIDLDSEKITVSDMLKESC